MHTEGEAAELADGGALVGEGVWAVSEASEASVTDWAWAEDWAAWAGGLGAAEGRERLQGWAAAVRHTIHTTHGQGMQTGHM